MENVTLTKEPIRRRLTQDPLKRFFARVRYTAYGCWEWEGVRTPPGYGRFSVGVGSDGYAHRWAYRRFIGPIPDGLDVHHLCGNRCCVNPSHLQAVCRRENLQRRAQKGTCRKPPDYDRIKSNGERDDEWRFLHSVRFTAYGCWEWTLGRNVRNRPIFSVYGHGCLADKWSYHHFVGETQPWQRLKHECLNPQCVNPSHLRPTTGQRPRRKR